MSKIERLLDRKVIWPTASDNKARCCTWCGAGQGRMQVCEDCGTRFCYECSGSATAGCPACVVLKGETPVSRQKKPTEEFVCNYVGEIVMASPFAAGILLFVVLGIFSLSGVQRPHMMEYFQQIYPQKKILEAEWLSLASDPNGYVLTTEAQKIECYGVGNGHPLRVIKPCQTRTYLVSSDTGTKTVQGPMALTSIVEAYFKATVPGYRGYALGD